MRLAPEFSLLIETVRAVAIIETSEPITSVGRLEEGDLDDLAMSDMSNQQIKEVSACCSVTMGRDWTQTDSIATSRFYLEDLCYLQLHS